MPGYLQPSFWPSHIFNMKSVHTRSSNIQYIAWNMLQVLLNFILFWLYRQFFNGWTFTYILQGCFTGTGIINTSGLLHRHWGNNIFSVASLVLGQSYDCQIADELMLNVINKIDYHQNKAWTLYITVTPWWVWYHLKSPASPLFTQPFSGADQSKHQSSVSLAFVQGIHRWPVNSPHKWPVTRKMFPFDDVIMT